MPGWNVPLLSKLLIRRRRPVVDTPQTPRDPGDEHLVARRLGEAIDQAMFLGQWSHADRIAASASRLGPKYPRLTGRLARLKLARRLPDEALYAIEACRKPSMSLRLLRGVCLLQLGRLAEAHLDLNAWAKESTAPIDGRVLAALLDWQVGEKHDAIKTLLDNARTSDDPDTLALLLLLGTRQGRREQARLWGRRLRDATAFGPRRKETTIMLHSLGLHEAARASRPTSHQVEILALELITCEEVIPALVETQRRKLDPAVADLLRGAIERARPDLVDETPACEALARLSLLRGESETALHWARRALQINPMSASATLLLRECAERIDESSDTADVIATIGGDDRTGRGRAA